MKHSQIELNMTVIYQNRRARVVELSSKPLAACRPRHKDSDGQRAMLLFEDNGELDNVPVAELRRAGRGK